jgi:polyphosphate glucokinase
MKFRKILGIDFGGSGIKGAPVNTKTGILLSKRFRLQTPMPATPESVLQTIEEIVENFRWNGPIGLAFPAAVQNGIIKTAANIDKSWIGVNAAKLISEKLDLPFTVINDADAAGLAEMKFGAGKGHKGVVLMVTVGTGIGSVLFSQGQLVPNTELGHIYLNTGIDAELFASDAVRQNEKLRWDEWARRFNIYLLEMQRLFWPELIIIGGGISKKKEYFIDHLTVSSEVVMARAKNEAGMIGAALASRAERKIFG